MVGQTDKVEGDGSWDANPSRFGFMGSAKSASVLNDDGSAVKPSSKEIFTFKTGTSWGSNEGVAREETSKVNPDASSIDHARTVKKDQSGGKLDPDHPSAVSQDMSMSILDAGMAANPGALGNVLQKAMQSMVMLKMMDKLSSPAGLLSMASGGMGGALQGLAKGVGVGSMLGALNGVMPGFADLNKLNRSVTETMHNGMMGMMNNVAVGALAANEVAKAASTASTIAGAMRAINSANGIDAIDAVASFGGPAFGLKPGSLASRIALIGPNQTIRTSSIYSGVKVNTTITTSPHPHATANIPILNGKEHIVIATSAIKSIGGELSKGLGISSALGGSLGSISNVTAGLSNISSAFNNISSFTPGNLSGIVNGGLAGVASGGLEKLLGVPTSGLLGAASKLLPKIGGNITGSLSSLNGIGANGGKLSAGLTNATKALSLSKAAHNVASNIFGEARAESVASAVDATAKLAVAVNGPISMVTAFGDKITSAPNINQLKSAVQAGAQRIIGSGQRV
jgi:hypothetical protein